MGSFDIVLMNSALALIAGGAAEDFKTAFAMAAESIDSGMANKKLEEVVRVSTSL